MNLHRVDNHSSMDRTTQKTRKCHNGTNHGVTVTSIGDQYGNYIIQKIVFPFHVICLLYGVRGFDSPAHIKATKQYSIPNHSSMNMLSILALQLLCVSLHVSQLVVSRLVYYDQIPTVLSLSYTCFFVTSQNLQPGVECLIFLKVFIVDLKLLSFI